MLKTEDFKLKKQTWKQLGFNVNVVRISIPGSDFEKFCFKLIIAQITIISKNKDKLVERQCKQTQFFPAMQYITARNRQL